MSSLLKACKLLSELLRSRAVGFMRFFGGLETSEVQQSPIRVDTCSPKVVLFMDTFETCAISSAKFRVVGILGMRCVAEVAAPIIKRIAVYMVANQTVSRIADQCAVKCKMFRRSTSMSNSLRIVEVGTIGVEAPRVHTDMWPVLAVNETELIAGELNVSDARSDYINNWTSDGSILIGHGCPPLDFVRVEPSRAPRNHASILSLINRMNAVQNLEVA